MWILTSVERKMEEGREAGGSEKEWEWERKRKRKRKRKKGSGRVGE
jgi:hypothetical protein